MINALPVVAWTNIAHFLIGRYSFLPDLTAKHPELRKINSHIIALSHLGMTQRESITFLFKSFIKQFDKLKNRHIFWMDRYIACFEKKIDRPLHRWQEFEKIHYLHFVTLRGIKELDLCPTRELDKIRNEGSNWANLMKLTLTNAQIEEENYMISTSNLAKETNPIKDENFYNRITYLTNLGSFPRTYGMWTSLRPWLWPPEVYRCKNLKEVRLSSIYSGEVISSWKQHFPKLERISGGLHQLTLEFQKAAHNHRIWLIGDEPVERDGLVFYLHHAIGPYSYHHVSRYPAEIEGPEGSFNHIVNTLKNDFWTRYFNGRIRAWTLIYKSYDSYLKNRKSILTTLVAGVIFSTLIFYIRQRSEIASANRFTHHIV